MKRLAPRVAAALAVMVLLAAFGSLPAVAHCQYCSYDNGEDNPYCEDFFVGYAECWVYRDNCWWWIFFCDYRCTGHGECRNWPG